MTIPIWLLFAALAAVVAAVGIAYRSGYLMGAESAVADVRAPINRRLGREVLDMIDGVERRKADAFVNDLWARGGKVPSDVDTVRERRASDSRTPGRIDHEGNYVREDWPV